MGMGLKGEEYSKKNEWIWPHKPLKQSQVSH